MRQRIMRYRYTERAHRTPPMLMNTLSEDVIHLRQIILKTEAQTKEVYC